MVRAAMLAFSTLFSMTSGCGSDGKPTALANLSDPRLSFVVARVDQKKTAVIVTLKHGAEGKRLRGDCPLLDVEARFGDIALTPTWAGGQVQCSFGSYAEHADCGQCLGGHWVGDITAWIPTAPIETTLTWKTAIEGVA